MRAKKQVILLTSITRHDILNQLTLLRGYTNLMKKQDTDERFREMIRKEETIADAITNQIIFTRDYQKVGSQPPGWINVMDTVRTVERSLDLGKAVIEVSTGDLEIYADTLIEKAFYNLVENSLRHGGNVTKIQFSAFEKEDGLVVACTDNGTGIPDEEKSLIFEKGYGKNTGLGLFLAREILTITGIAIAETGEPGNGVRFEMTVPRGSYRFAGRESPGSRTKKTGAGKTAAKKNASRP